MQVISAKIPPAAPLPSVAPGLPAKAAADSGKAAAHSSFSGIVLQLLPAEGQAPLSPAAAAQTMEPLSAWKPAIPPGGSASAPNRLLAGKSALSDAKREIAASIERGSDPRNPTAAVRSVSPSLAASRPSRSPLDADAAGASASPAGSGNPLSSLPAAATPPAIPPELVAEANPHPADLRFQPAKKTTGAAAPPQEHPKRAAPRSSKTAPVSGAALPSAAVTALPPASSGVSTALSPLPKPTSSSIAPAIPVSRSASIPSGARAPQNTTVQRPGTPQAAVPFPPAPAAERQPSVEEDRCLSEKSSPSSSAAGGDSASHIPPSVAAAAPAAAFPHIIPHAGASVPDAAPPAALLHAAPPAAQVSIVSHAVHAPSVAGVSAFERMDAVAAPQVLESTTQRLAVGVRDPGLGWVEIHAHVAGGEVAATLAAASTESHAVLAVHLPAMQNDLAPQHIRLEHAGVQNFSSSSHNQEGSSPQHDRPPAAHNNRVPELTRAGPIPPGEATVENLSYISVRV